jgi:uncharacterized protein YcaQ
MRLNNTRTQDVSSPIARTLLNAEEARALALRAQGFGASWSGHPFEVLQRLGAVQLDSVNVLARSHHLPPFSRLGAYSLANMHHAVYHERRGFEYWGHEACWLPMAEYRHFLPRVERMRQETRGWFATSAARTEHADLYRYVLDRIRAEGPLGSAAFENTSGRRGTWWDWKPAKRVLENLFDCGELMAADRTAGVARMYDLTERVLPAWVDTTNPGRPAATRHLLRRAVTAYGIATPSEAAGHFRLRPADWKPALADLLEAGEVVQVTEGWRQPGLAVPSALSGPLDVPDHRPTFLSPFDNLLWSRDRVERLFNFRYRVEIFVPEPKRQYGYYVLPLLARGQLLGRADLKLDRKRNLLLVRGLWLEGATPEEATAALRDLAAQLGVGDICLERADQLQAVATALARPA